jgi:hypothetical protein
MSEREWDIEIDLVPRLQAELGMVHVVDPDTEQRLYLVNPEFRGVAGG